MAHAEVGQPRQRNATGGDRARVAVLVHDVVQGSRGLSCGRNRPSTSIRRRARHQRGTGSAKSGRDRRRDLPRPGGKRHETQTVRAPTHADVVTSARRRTAGRVTGRRSGGPIRARWCVGGIGGVTEHPSGGAVVEHGLPALHPCLGGRGVERLGDRTRDVGRRAQPLLALVGYATSRSPSAHCRVARVSELQR
jgi:hypothetical protein